MAKIIKVRDISHSMIYGVPSVFVDFNFDGVSTTEDNQYFENENYKYEIISFPSFPEQDEIYGYDIVNVGDFVNDPDSMKNIGQDLIFEYEGKQDTLKEQIIDYLEKNKLIV